MLNFNYLFKEQVFGDSQLGIFRKYGTTCQLSDFAKLLGGYVSSSMYDIEGGIKRDYVCQWWLRTFHKNKAHTVFFENLSRERVNRRDIGARPVLSYSAIKNLSSNAEIGDSGVLEIEYGEYPQTVADNNISNQLDYLFGTNSLKRTGKKYTADSVELKDYSTPFQAREFEEYEYNGEKYIRFVADEKNNGENLSNGNKITKGNTYWIKVEPIKWLVDLEEDIAVAKNCLFSGIQFKNKCDYQGYLEDTDLKWFTDNCFAKEINSSKSIIESLENQSEDQKSIIENKSENQKSIIKKYNPYNFDLSTVSEEEIIKGAIESDVAVYLHGRSSEGKSSRIKQLDPECEIVYLVSASIDSINGKSVYNQDSGEMIDIPPTWYQNLVRKCEEEPDKIHIVFFDELANADRSIRKSIFNVVLDKEVNGKWKLPSNARIAAAGNEMEDSSVAEDLPEPLFNRFAHVYIHTPVEAWLTWAITDNDSYQRLDYENKERKYKIHPAIYSFILCRGEKALRSKYDGKKPNADPRKWELASKILEITNQPEMMRALIGDEITADFISFCTQNIITLDAVLNNSYTDADLEMDYSKKVATVMGLIHVGIENLEQVRNFIMKLGPAFCAQFDNLWARGDLERLEQIAFLQEKDKEKRGVRK